MKKFLLLILIILGLAFVYFHFSYSNFKEKVIFTNEQNIEINRGETYYSLAKKLKLNDSYLKFYLKQNPPKKGLQAGTYKVTAGTNLAGLIKILEGNAISNDISLTIIEGLNIYDIDSILTKKSLIKTGEFIAYEKDNLQSLKDQFPFLKYALTLEGFLYPDTYNVNPNNFSLDNFVKTKLLANFETKVIKGLNLNPDDKNLLDNIIMASIVEKEEKNSSEKSIVAGVLKKRLKEGWQIGADATVCYPYELTYDECTPNFIVNHIHDKNDYNTRTMIGLPKTPICNPSAETIEATINSKDSPYYFYLHAPNGQIHYATTNEEHEANKDKYLK